MYFVHTEFLFDGTLNFNLNLYFSPLTYISIEYFVKTFLVSMSIFCPKIFKFIITHIYRIALTSTDLKTSVNIQSIFIFQQIF